MQSNTSADTALCRLSSAVPDITWHYAEKIESPDLLQDAELYLAAADFHEKEIVYVAPLVRKRELETLYSHWYELRQDFFLITGRACLMMPQIIEVSRTGYTYLRLPNRTGAPLKVRLRQINKEQELELVTHLAVLLRTMHGPPGLQNRCSNLIDDVRPDVLPSRSTIWMRLAALFSHASTHDSEVRRTPVLGDLIENNLLVSPRGELFLHYPPLLQNGDPWADVARLALLLGEHDPSLRELLINLYFFLDVPERFFSAYYIYVYRRLIMDVRMQDHDAKRMASIEASAVRLSEDYDSVSSTIPNWYDRSTLIRQIRENGGAKRL